MLTLSHILATCVGVKHVRLWLTVSCHSFNLRMLCSLCSIKGSYWEASRQRDGGSNQQLSHAILSRSFHHLLSHRNAIALREGGRLPTLGTRVQAGVISLLHVWCPFLSIPM